MLNPSRFRNLPVEMQSFKQWVVCGDDKIPYTLGFHGTFVKAKVTDLTTLLSFEQAVQCAEQYGINIGFVLSDFDPFTCIDLDIKDHTNKDVNGVPVDESKWTSPEEIQRYSSMVSHFNSFTEVSTSGRGLHIWVKAKIGAGRRREGVEIYSQERFIICTGNPISSPAFDWEQSKGWYISHGIPQALPLAERQELTDAMASQMLAAGAARAPTEQLVEVDQSYTDEQIWDMGCKAENASKFIDLCQGKWLDYKYPSQSEADLSLMSMFTFYSKSNAQCKRLFRCTQLGKREKAVKDDRYLNFTLGLIRQRQKEEQAVQDSIIAMIRANDPNNVEPPPVETTVKSVVKPSKRMQDIEALALEQSKALQHKQYVERMNAFWARLQDSRRNPQNIPHTETSFINKPYDLEYNSTFNYYNNLKLNSQKNEVSLDSKKFRFNRIIYNCVDFTDFCILNKIDYKPTMVYDGVNFTGVYEQGLALIEADKAELLKNKGAELEDVELSECDMAEVDFTVLIERYHPQEIDFFDFYVNNAPDGYNAEHMYEKFRANPPDFSKLIAKHATPQHACFKPELSRYNDELWDDVITVDENGNPIAEPITPVTQVTQAVNQALAQPVPQITTVPTQQPTSKITENVVEGVSKVLGQPVNSGMTSELERYHRDVPYVHPHEQKQYDAAKAEIQLEKETKSQALINERLKNSEEYKANKAKEDLRKPVPVDPNKSIPDIVNYDKSWFVDLEERAHENQLPWPPGVLGQMTHYFMQMSYRPVMEVSLTGVLGLVSGICGRAWNISGSGLSNYYILIGASGIGKEHMHSGVDLVLNNMDGISHDCASRFVIRSKQKSGSALQKTAIKSKSATWMVSEFGKLFTAMCDSSNMNPNAKDLKDTLLELHSKSGNHSRVGGMDYSNKENNIDDVKGGIALSLAGETTPENFYSVLTSESIADGFLSRFTPILCFNSKGQMGNDKVEDFDDYEDDETIDDGYRDNPTKIIPEKMTQLLVNMSLAASNNVDEDLATDILMSDEFKKRYGKLKRFITKAQRGIGDNEVRRSFYARINMHVLKLASLAAICNQFGNGYTIPTECASGRRIRPPVITTEEGDWAIDLIMRNVRLMEQKYANGEIGKGNINREKRLVKVIQSYLDGKYDKSKITNVDARKKSIISYHTIVSNCRNHASFNSEKHARPNDLIRNLIDTYVAIGVLQPMDDKLVISSLKNTGKHYYVMADNLVDPEEARIKGLA